MDDKPLARDPLWYQDAVIYELHVKAFYDSKDDGIGDFPGLLEKLDYLQDLGITCVWLLPFCPSPLRDDGYDIADYRGVHPAYGTRREFRQFVREAHRRGIRVITELVVNHTSDQHPWFQAARRAPAGSTKRNFYVWSDSDQKYRDARIIFTDFEKSNWTWDPLAKAYYWHRFFHHQPDLNYDNPHVRKAMLRMMCYWFDMGVDGLRLDAIPYLVEREGTNCENLAETHDILREWRREVDARYHGRMLLAEANQWPTDVLPYFGDGDECHMAFHFPLMTRFFVALRQEDRHPIIEIMRQTPEIPAECQWALFLRNHDELTLEMVTDEERDYMYQEYAADPQARVNLGIRRRLAPLLGNSRRRIELLKSLLFSLPGTPVIYYGDELGMGDNVYLGDRDSVRTPMQWTGDRNAGFSRADFAKLYLPPIMDAVYGYQAINVESQQRDPSSLLNWMQRLIALRKRFKAFSRGAIEFLHPQNRKILAYVRTHGDETILAVANLSRFVQPVELDLSRFKGLTPVEPLGRVPFPPIGEGRYFLSLGPHSFYWLQLERAPEILGVRPLPPVEETGAVPLVTIAGSWSTLMEGKTRATLERFVLPKFLRRQRWFGAKTRTLETVSIRDWATLTTDPAPAFLVLVKLHYSDGGSDDYFVPFAVASGPRADELVQTGSPSLLARLKGPQAEAVLYDVLADAPVCARLLSSIEAGRQWRTQIGRMRAFATSAYGSIRGDADPTLDISAGPADPTNSLVIFGRRLLLNVFRHLEAGTNPDYELGRYLTERAGFDRAARLAGAIEYQPSRGEVTTLALLHEFVPNQGSGWQHALDELGRFFERAFAQSYVPSPIGADGHWLLHLAETDPPLPVAETLGPVLNVAVTLGRRTAELHLALARETDDPAFAPEPLTVADLAALSRRLHDEVQKASALVGQKIEQLPEPSAALARRLLHEGHGLVEHLEEQRAAGVSATKIRCHGDYHLGQVLWVENDFVILNSVGEPARTFRERRAKESPLRDVAGMLRSFDYAAFSGLLHFTQDRPEHLARLEPWARLWRQRMSAAFLREFRLAAAGATFLPDAAGPFLSLLESFLLEKACYEVEYELNHRPNWARIPLAGIVEMIDKSKGQVSMAG